MYIAFDNEPKKNNRLGVIIFLICIVVLMLMASATNAQQQLVRQKTGNYWQAMCIKTFTDDLDTIYFGSAYYPTPYNFFAITVTTTNKDKCVRHLIMEVMYKDNMVDYLSSYNDLNCDGSSWFNLSAAELNRLRTKEIKHIKLTNSHNHHSFDVEGFDSIQYYKIVLNN